MQPGKISPDAVRAQLERVLASSAFQGAERSRTLLRFLVDQSLDDRTDRLKEYTLGVEALGRGDTFDPRTDPIVRAEMSRLRSRLERYYATDGLADDVAIVLPKGSYVAQFQERRQTVTDGGAPAIAATSAQSIRAVALTWLVLGIAAGASAVAAFIGLRPASSAGRPVMQFEVELQSTGSLESEASPDVIISPDGTRVVFVSLGSDGVPRLKTRRLDQSMVTDLPGTDGARAPFFSPDGDWVAFEAAGALKKTAIEGGSPVVLREAVNLLGGSWGDDGNIYAALNFGKLWRVSSSSGEARVIADVTSGAVDARWPQVLPGSRSLLFTAVGRGGPNDAMIEALSLVDGTRKVLVRRGTFGRYLSAGYLTYLNQGTLFAVHFDVDRMEAAAASPTPVVNGVAYSSTFGFAQLDVSRTGTLVYRRSPPQGQLVVAWLDRSGKTEPLLTKPGDYAFPSLSPDGRRVAVMLVENGIPNVWIYDRQLNRTTRLSAGPDAYAPTWTRDGRMLVIGGRSGLHWLTADGTRSGALTDTNAVQIPWSFSPDGTRLAYHELNPETAFDLWTVPVNETASGLTAGEPELFLRTTTYETYPTFSPDGRWIAYGWGAYGTWDVYVRPFPDTGAQPVQVSHGGGRIPRWLPNGRELLYRTDDQRLMLTSYTVKDGIFVVDTAREWCSRLLGETGVLANFDIDRDGSRVLALMPARPEDEQHANHVTVEINFWDELHRAVERHSKR